MQERASLRGISTLVTLAVVGVLNYVDRQILPVMIEPIKLELHFSDTEFGLLTGLSFSLFYALVGLPAALIADRGRRVRVIVAACAIWSVFTALTGGARSFGAMAVARFGVGVGEAGGTAPSVSVLSEYFPRNQRPLVIGLFTLNGPVGVFIGAAFGGWAAAHIGWRSAFYILGAIGVVAAPLLWLTVPEPPRRLDDGEAAPASQVTIMGTLRLFVTDPSLRLLSIATGLSNILSYGMLNWIPAFLLRVDHMPLSALASWFAVAAGGTMGLGMVVGGALTKAATRRSARGYATVPAIATAILLPVYGLSLLAQSWPAALALMLLPMACCVVFTPASLALAQELGPPNGRATVVATLLLMYNIVGLGLGSLFVGVVSDLLAPSLGVGSLRVGILLLLIPGALAVLVYWRLARALGEMPSPLQLTDTATLPSVSPTRL